MVINSENLSLETRGGIDGIGESEGSKQSLCLSYEKDIARMLFYNELTS